MAGERGENRRGPAPEEYADRPPEALVDLLFNRDEALFDRGSESCHSLVHRAKPLVDGCESLVYRCKPVVHCGEPLVQRGADLCLKVVEPSIDLGVEGAEERVDLPVERIRSQVDLAIEVIEPRVDAAEPLGRLFEGSLQMRHPMF